MMRPMLRHAMALAVVCTLSPVAAVAQINWGLARQPDYSGGAINAYRAGQEARQARELHERQMAEYEAERQRAAIQAADAEAERIWMSGIVHSVARGDCDEAKADALRAGRLEVADQVVRVCTPKPAPPQTDQ